jgi:hypothetical protein
MENTKKTSNLAIVGFVLSFFSTLVGLIVSIVALGQIKKTGEDGRGLAIAGIVISSVSTVIATIVAVFVFVLAGQFISQTQIYSDAVAEVNSSIDTYNQLTSLDILSADADDVTALKTAAAADANKIRQVVSDLGLKIEQLGDNEVFKVDAEAKRLYDELKTKFAVFEPTYNHAASIYDSAANGNFAAMEEIATSSDLVTNDIDAELNALNQYLERKSLLIE